MKAPKSLGKPRNWQDFETLCKKLWGEIWNCPEIKKNGRNGQTQHGVDVYGIPSYDSHYYGIQCKGKDDYSNQQLTIKEIDEEIKKARLFEPKLKKLYFATTAPKDVVIEKEIRVRNLNHKRENLFEIHLFAWEDIVDLIEENSNTYNYYVKSINFKSLNSVSVTFQNDSTELSITPKFQKEITQYIQQIVPRESTPTLSDLNLPIALQTLMSRNRKLATISYSSENNKSRINYSYGEFYLKINNTGDAPIEEYQILLEFNGNITDLSNTNEIAPVLMPLKITSKLYLDTFLNKEDLTGKIKPFNNILVGDDAFKSDTIFIKPFHEESQIIINWKLLSKNYKDQGQLTINVHPQILTKHNEVLVKDPTKVRIEESNISDYIAEKITEQ